MSEPTSLLGGGGGGPSSSLVGRSKPEPPFIVVQGVPASCDERSFRRIVGLRGFVVESFKPDAIDKSTTLSSVDSRGVAVSASAILSISLRLRVRLAALGDCKVENAGVREIGPEALAILRRSGVNFEDAWVAHDPQRLRDLLSNEEWLRFYTYYLFVPAFFGLLVFAIGFSSSPGVSPDESSWMTGAFHLLLCVGGTVFVESWKRRSAELAHTWGVETADDEAGNRELLQSLNRAPVDRRLRFAFTVPCIFIILLAVVRVTVFFLGAIEAVRVAETLDAAAQTSSLSPIPPLDWLVSYARHIWPYVAYACVPVVLSTAYSKIAVALNNFEQHPTKIEAENNLIFKQFVFQCINRYCALFYTAFWLQDFARLRTLLMSMLVTNAVINNITEVLVPAGPAIVKYATIYFAGGQTTDDKLTRNSPTETRSAWGEMLEKELQYPEYDLTSDYMEMLVQYGYCSLFAVAFPLGPMLAFVNNLFEWKVDKTKLGLSRRPPFIDRTSIGAWEGCFEILNGVSVITNCYFLCMTPGHLSTIFPHYFSAFAESEYGRFAVMVMLEHAIFLFKIALAYLIPDVPMWVREERAKLASSKRHREQVVLMNALVSRYASDENSRLWSGKSASLASAQARSELLLQEKVKEASKNYAIGKLANSMNSSMFYNPESLAWILGVPALLQHLAISPAYYVPVCFLVLSYMSSEKSKWDKHQALGIVTDKQVLEHVIKELPGWVTDSECERAQWLNDILQKLWPFLSQGVEALLKGILDPVFASLSSPIIPSLKVVKISLGTNAPRIVSVRSFPSRDVGCVRLDIELKWISNAEVSLCVGRTPPLYVEIDGFQLSTTLRIELRPLVSKLPGFGGIYVTCMKAPFIDFAVRVASVDLLHIGPAELSIGTYVRNLIIDIICGMMLYPKTLTIPLFDDPEIVQSLSAAPSPKGLLHLTIVGAKKLKAADVISSDPFVEVHYMTEVFKTEVKTKTLNPAWNTSFDLMIFDKGTQQIEFAVYDDDLVSTDFLGKAVLHLDSLKPGVSSEFELDLMDVETGTLLVSCLYTSLSSGDDDTEIHEHGETVDILFDMSAEDLISDVLQFAPDKIPSDEERSSVFSQNSATLSIGSISKLMHQVSKFASASTNSESIKSPKLENLRTSKGVVSISSISCSQLRNTHSYGSGIRPYVIFSIGGISKQTAVHRDISDPTFEESFHFVVKDVENTQLIARVYDSHKFQKDKIIGEVVIRLADLGLSTGGTIKTYPLESRQGECFLTCKIALAALTK